MDKTKELYKAVASGNFAEANKLLESILEEKSGERITNVLKAQGEE